MFNSTFCGAFVQSLGKPHQGWWSDALWLTGLFLWLNGTHDPLLRGEAEPMRTEYWGSAVPEEIRVTYPLPRVRDVHL